MHPIHPPHRYSDPERIEKLAERKAEEEAALAAASHRLADDHVAEDGERALAADEGAVRVLSWRGWGPRSHTVGDEEEFAGRPQGQGISRSILYHFIEIYSILY